jgi:FkbM family methyltransferase
MRTKKIISLFTEVYGLIRPEGLFEISPFRRAYIFAYFRYKKIFEDPFWGLAQTHPRLFHDGDILDIGANIGYTACIFAQAMTAGSKVFAFEPDWPSYTLLKEVVRHKNLISAIEMFNTAIGQSEGTVEFWHNQRHPADHRVVTKHFRELRDAGTTFWTIPITTIDTFVADRDLRKISFIKIDVQGYELAVCEGMKKTLEKFPKLCVCLEYSPQAMVELGFEPDKLLDFFKAAGYKSYCMTNGNPKILTDNFSIKELLERTEYFDLLFSKQDLL